MKKSLWWLDDAPPWEQDAPVEDFFSDLVGGVTSLATLPAKAVASVLPKSVQKKAEFLLDPAGALVNKQIASATGIGAKPRPPVRALPAGPVPKVPVPGPLTADQIALQKLAAAKPPGMSNAEYIQMLKAEKARRQAGGGGAAGGPRKLVAKSTSPKITARSSGKANGQAALIELTASAVNRKLAPELSSINKKLTLAQNQRTATSEHNALNNQRAFRRKVLGDLTRIAGCLPDDHPMRKRVRRFGIFSGML